MRALQRPAPRLPAACRLGAPPRRRLVRRATSAAEDAEAKVSVVEPSAVEEPGSAAEQAVVGSHPLPDIQEAAQELLTELQDQSQFGKRGEAWTLAQIAVMVLVLLPPFQLTGLVDILATLLITSGLVFMVYGVVSLGRFISPLPAPRARHELVTSGMFSYMRHPMYAGLLAAAFGLAVITRNETRLAMAALLWAVLERKVGLEERLLQERYGKLYDDYRAKVAKFIPFMARATSANTAGSARAMAAAEGAEEASLELVVKQGGTELAVAAAPGSTVAALKAQLEAATGVFARHQKLIFKGKVLDDAATLASCKLSSGAKVMLMQSQGLPVKGQPAGPRPSLAQQRLAAAAAAAKGKAAAAGGAAGGGGSVLADKLASMAAARAGGAAAAAGLSLPERRAAWAKTGVIALRDMQLAALQPEWLEGIGGAPRAADFSHNCLAALPDSLCGLGTLASLKLTHNALDDAGVPWPALASGLSGLTSLLLGHNQLTVVPACLGQLGGLVQLGLEANRLASIEEGALEGLPRLEILQLQDNALQALPEGLGRCSGLVALNASRNALRALPDATAALARLQVLAVDANRLAALPARLLAGCSSLATLSAHGNPLTVEALRSAEGYDAYEARRRARATKQLEGRVLADVDRAFSEGADVEQWARWAGGPAGLGRDGTGRAGRTPAAQRRRGAAAALLPRPPRRERGSPACRAADDEDTPSTSYQSSLEITIKRKSKQVEAALLELGMEGLEERLSSATANPASPAYRLSRMIAEVGQMQGRAVIVVEVTRPSPSTTPQQLAALATQAIACGADALCVRLDSEDTPSGTQDLFAVVQAARRTPVLARDWVIHPLQLVEAKEAGAAGVLGVIGQVNGRGTAVMSSFGAALGLDAPVEVVNAREVEGLSRAGVVFYGINLSVGLSVAVPGFAADMAHGLLGELPFGAVSIVGVKDVEGARAARASGADAVLVKKEMIDAAAAEGRDLRTLLAQNNNMATPAAAAAAAPAAAAAVVAAIPGGCPLRHVETSDRSAPAIESDASLKTWDKEGLLAGIEAGVPLKHVETVDKAKPVIEPDVHVQPSNRAELLQEVRAAAAHAAVVREVGAVGAAAGAGDCDEDLEASPLVAQLHHVETADKAKPALDPSTHVQKWDKEGFLSEVAAPHELRHVDPAAVHDASAPSIPADAHVGANPAKAVLEQIAAGQLPELHHVAAPR
ncbi:hypothetical protein HT031_000230 [Scenedesmus sp. PABB004]|nr:hypothetical protein HT031_000230 [Scenedesmus sp. PABB004]